MRVDPADLLDASEVAKLLGLSHRQAVATYAKRYDDFPKPIVDKGSGGACRLWLKADVVAWRDARRAR